MYSILGNNGSNCCNVLNNINVVIDEEKLDDKNLNNLPIYEPGLLVDAEMLIYIFQIR